MFIYDLSPDILLNIVELCANKDAYALALCCRDAHHALSNTLAKHQRLGRQWNTIDADDDRRPFQERILKVIRKPQLTSYIKTLSFDCELEGRTISESEMTEIKNRLLNLGRSNWSLFEDICGDFGHLADESLGGDFHPDGYSCQLQWLSILLVILVPNLRRLLCVGCVSTQDKLLLLLAKVARMSPPMSALPLQQLKIIEVKLERGVDEGGLPMDWLLASLNLPSVRTFTASRMSSSSVYLELKEEVKSNLETLILEDCIFEPDVLARVLGSIPNLRTFAYSNGQNYNVGYDSFSPKRITGALVLHTAHCLEHLTICGEDEDGIDLVHTGLEWPHVSLADFEKLKTLRCYTSLLTSDPNSVRPETHDTVSIETGCRTASGRRYETDDFLQPTPGTLRRLAFAARLPHSLEALHLEDYPCHTPLAYSALSEFVQKSDGLLPSLKKLYLNDWGLEYLQNKGLLGMIAQKGLKYKALHDPFQLSTGIRLNCDDMSAYQVDS